MHSLHATGHFHRDDRRSFEDHVAIQTSDFDFAGIDERLGWAEPSTSPGTPPATFTPPATIRVEPFDEHTESSDEDMGPPTPVDLPGQDAIIKVLAMLVDSSDFRLTLFTLVSAFGLSTLNGGRSFRNLAADCGVSVAAFSKRVLTLQERFHLPKTRDQKSEAAQASYAVCQKAVWANPERRKKGIGSDCRHSKKRENAGGVVFSGQQARSRPASAS